MYAKWKKWPKTVEHKIWYRKLTIQISTVFFYKQLKNKQLGPVFAKKISNFLSNFWPDFQPGILSNFY